MLPRPILNSHWSRRKFVGSPVNTRRQPLRCILAAIAITAATPTLGFTVCNLIPVAELRLPSVQGGTNTPIAGPGDIVEITLNGCEQSTGFEPVGSNHTVTLRFEPPAAAESEFLLPNHTINTTDCGDPGERCTQLSFPFPDTSALFPPRGLAGPVRILVEDSSSDVVAEIGELFLPSGGCDREPDRTFHQFTALPPATLFADIGDGTAAEVLATIDGGGNVLIPLDYWGGGSDSVLPETPGAPIAVILEGAAQVPAFTGQPQTILDTIAARPDASSFVRSYTRNGRPLPPLLRIASDNGDGKLFGTADAERSVLRIAVDDGLGGPALFDLSDQLSDGGRGPLVITSHVGAIREPLPLAGLIESPAVAAYVRSELREGSDLNGDGDIDDFVVSILNTKTGASFSSGRAVSLTTREMSIFEQLDFPTFPHSAVAAIEVSSDWAAFFESEAAEGATDTNQDGDTRDHYLRAYDHDQNELTGGTDIEVATGPNFDGRPLAISGSKVFFRGPNFLQQTVTETMDPRRSSRYSAKPRRASHLFDCIVVKHGGSTRLRTQLDHRALDPRTDHCRRDRGRLRALGCHRNRERFDRK